MDFYTKVSHFLQRAIHQYSSLRPSFQLPSSLCGLFFIQVQSNLHTHTHTHTHIISLQVSHADIYLAANQGPFFLLLLSLQTPHCLQSLVPFLPKLTTQSNKRNKSLFPNADSFFTSIHYPAPHHHPYSLSCLCYSEGAGSGKTSLTSCSRHQHPVPG